MYEEKIVIRNQISWRSIFAGVIAVLAISMLLSLLGVALGFALLDHLDSSFFIGKFRYWWIYCRSIGWH